MMAALPYATQVNHFVGKDLVRGYSMPMVEEGRKERASQLEGVRLTYMSRRMPCGKGTNHGRQH